MCRIWPHGKVGCGSRGACIVVQGRQDSPDGS